MKTIHAMTWCVVLCVLITKTANAQTLEKGDVVFSLFNTDESDLIELTVLKDVEDSLTLHLTDKCWFPQGSTQGTPESFRSGEGTLTLKIPTGVPCGTKLKFETETPLIEGGSIQETGSFSLSGSGDQVFLFQGTLEDPVFIFALTTKSGGWSADPQNNSNDSGLPETLKEGGHVEFDVHKDNWKLNLQGEVTQQAFRDSVTRFSAWSSHQDSIFLESDFTLICTDEVSLGFKEDKLDCQIVQCEEGVFLMNPKNEELEMTLFDLTGRKIKTEQISTARYALTLENKPGGLYICRLANTTRKQTTSIKVWLP